MRTIIFAAAALALTANASEEFGFRAKYVKTVDVNARTIIATKCEQAPKFDGTLNDPIWAKAGRTQSAFTNFPATDACGRQTIVFCCYDQNALYIAFDCEEPELDQQQIDNKNILAADHVGVHLEIGDTRGRGPRCFVMGNRGGITAGGAWQGQLNLPHECKAGPNRWYFQLAIPFKNCAGMNGPPLRGEVWGVKFTRYGKNSETGASRMRSCWPHIPTIVEDVVTYNANLCFGAESMIENGTFAGNGNEIAGWKTAHGQAGASDGKLSADAGVTLQQDLALRAGVHYAVEWTGGEAFKGEVSALAGDKPLVSQDLSKGHRVDFALPKGISSATVAVKLTGSGAPPSLRMKPVLDDVPADWICLTNNDWVPERNLKNRIPGSADGTYTYLKTPMRDFGMTPYKSRGCPNPDVKELPYEWMITGRPIRKPLDAPAARPDIGEEEFESFPYAVIYSDGAVPEFCGLPSGSFDVGGDHGWIPFSKGSLTGDESWAGWPVTRWSGVAPHDIVMDFKDKYYIRRIDIQQINTGVRNLEMLVRSTSTAEESFVSVYRFNGPGTERGLNTILPVYFSQAGIDSVAQQLRLSLGVSGYDRSNNAAVSIPNLGRVNCEVGLFGVAEIWVWAEPKGAHADNEIKEFKAIVPNAQPPIKFDQLQKWPEPIIWPRPKQLVKADGKFEIKATTAIAAEAAGQLPELTQWLKSEIKEHFCADLPLKADDGLPAENTISIGIKGSGGAFDTLLAKEALEIGSGEPQSYAVKITPSRVVIAATDIEGAAHGLRAVMQWMDHDELTAFLRCATIHDWPLLKLRTLVPSADHRKALLPSEKNPANYTKIINGLSYLRFNSVVDWLPTAICENEAKTRELIHFASSRFTDIRPALWVQRVPGDCIEANPDDQPDGGAGIGNSDGWWESDNMCPSNPKSYVAIEDFLDAALKTHDTSRYIEVGFMGSMGKNWNVCRLCRKRGLSGFELYGDFVNKVNAICRAKNRAAIFTNAIMLSDAVQRASAGKDVNSAFDGVNRGIALRYDNPAETAQIMRSGFWTISKPWDTPNPVNSGAKYSWGGKAYFDSVHDSAGSEGVIGAGEACDWEWAWHGEMCSRVMMTADQFWNGPAPAGAEYKQYEQLVANECVRFNQRISTGIEYPSWRTGMTPKFFNVDIRSVCTRSHIDEGSASGPARSGPKEGVNGFGASFDFRRVPMGQQTFAGIPFEVIDPAKNKWKSMLVVSTAPKEALIPGTVSRAAIPVNRKAASFCVLRTNLRTVFRAGQTDHYPNILQPAYVFEYADGSRCVCDWEIRRHYDDICTQSFYYGGSLRTSVLNFLLSSTRLGYATNTVSGAGANVFINEIVNPYPDKEVRNLLIQLPNPEQRDFTFEFHDAIFAVTGVEPVEWDSKFWSQHSKPLLPPNATIPPDAKKVEGVKFSDNAKLPVRIYQCALAKPSEVSALTFRLFMPGNYGGRATAVNCRHADCKILVTQDQKTWTEIAKIKGCCGMDGEHILAWTPQPITGLQVVVDCSAYNDEDNSDIGLLACDLFAK